MSTVDELEAGIDLIDTKLDEVRAYIATLQVGVPLTQERLDTLVAKVNAVHTEADDLDAAGNPITPAGRRNR